MRRGDAPALMALIQVLKRFPTEVIRRHPWLIINQATALMATTQYRQAEKLLDELESQIKLDDPSILGALSAVRAVIAVMCYRPDQISVCVEQAFHLLQPDAIEWHGLVAWSMAHSYRQNGNSHQAASAFEAMLPWLTEDPTLRLVTQANHAEQMRLQGRLYDAHTLHQSLIAVHQHSRYFQIGVSYIFGSEILLEWNRLDEAWEWVQQGMQQAHAVGSLELLVFGGVAQARILRARGEPEVAANVIEDTLVLHYDVVYLQRYVHACKAWLHLLQGEVQLVEQWVEKRGFDPDGPIPYLEEYEYYIFARWLLHQQQARAAIALLQRLVAQAEVGGRMNDAIHYRVLQAIAHNKLNEREQAKACLLPILPQAFAQGYLRVFTNEGRTMADLLVTLATQVTLTPELSHWVHRSVAALPHQLAEALTDRELEVLRLIAIGFSNQQIANHLIVSVNTVKTHIKHLYEKFAVNSRIALIEQARTANIL